MTREEITKRITKFQQGSNTVVFTAAGIDFVAEALADPVPVAEKVEEIPDGDYLVEIEVVDQLRVVAATRRNETWYCFERSVEVTYEVVAYRPFPKSLAKETPQTANYAEESANDMAAKFVTADTEHPYIKFEYVNDGVSCPRYLRPRYDTRKDCVLAGIREDIVSMLLNYSANLRRQHAEEIRKAVEGERLAIAEEMDRKAKMGIGYPDEHHNTIVSSTWSLAAKFVRARGTK